MKAKLFLTMFSSLLLACSVVTPSVHAFYNPQPGRWLNRDPIEEPGFRLSTATNRKANTKHEVQVYVFVANNPLSYWDYLGLDNPGCDLPSWLQPTGGNADC